MAKHNFQDVVRAERYFTATLLPHLLMGNDFEGIKYLFRYLFSTINFEESTDFEIVTELDPIRDASLINKDIQLLFKDHGRVAVPDLFIRWGAYIIVIEAKFFTLPYWDDLEYQVNEQKRAIELVINNTNYDINKFMYCLLLIEKPTGMNKTSIRIITWDEIIKMMESKMSHNISADFRYSFDIIKHSIVRAKKEFEKQPKITFIKIKNIDVLIQKMPELISKGKIWVGFSEGITLQTIDLNYLKNRSHYKVTDNPGRSTNWIRIDKLIAKYLDLNF